MVLPRQQTLAASVEWSYDLLDDVECRVLRRLGVFAGAFSLGAAEAIVSAAGDVNPIAVFDTISRLVDKSLVLSDESDDSGDSLATVCSQTIRAFAVNRAHDAGELAGLRTAHAAWWSERVEALRVTGPTDDVIAMVDANHDDLIAALSWAARNDVELGLRLLWPLARAFQGTGRAGDAMAACDGCSRPTSSSGTRNCGCGPRISASVPVSGFRGPQAFVELVTRCASHAAELNDDYRLAVSRWLLGMSVDTDRELVRQAEQQREPYVLALATVRLALDAALAEPATAREALQAADAIAASYDSQYIRDYTLAARSAQAIVFGDLSVVLDAGRRLVDSPTRAMQVHGISALTAPACCVVTTRRSTRRGTWRNGHAARQRAGRDRRSRCSPHGVLGLLRGDADRNLVRELADQRSVACCARLRRSAATPAQPVRPSHRSRPAAPPARRWPTPSRGSSTTTKIAGTRHCDSRTGTTSD